MSRIIFSGLLLTIFWGCSEKPVPAGQTQVTFHFSDLPKTSEKDPNKHSWGEATPSTAADIDCVGVFVRYPELSGAGTCNDGTETLAYVNQLVGLVSRSSTASATIRSGSARTFYLVGFGSTTGACPSFSSLGPTQEAYLSEPVLLGSTTVDVQGTSQAVNLSGSVSGQTIIEECSGGPFNWDSSLGMYGDGSDNSPSPASTFSTLSGTAQTYITGMDSSSGTQISVGSATGFTVGDEVLWQIIGTGVGGTGCNTPGYTRDSGLTGMTEITAISGTDFTLLDPIVGPAGGAASDVNNALSSGRTTNNIANTWCRISLVKVPHYQNLSISSSSLSSDTFNYANAASFYGGIIVFRVNGTLTLSSGTISTLGKGYQKNLGYAGESPYGDPETGTTDAVNGTGGGWSGTGPGGGGGSSWGIGGNNNFSTPNGGGVSVSCSASGDYLCMQMGGAGGEGGSGTETGSGGGIIIIYARNIEISGTSSITANGTTEGTTGGGGGGGFIRIATSSLTINSGASLSITANGGNAGTSGSGAGSGGEIVFRSCSTTIGSSASFTYTSNSGTTGAGTGSAGSSPTPTVYTSTCP